MAEKREPTTTEVWVQQQIDDAEGNLADFREKLAKHEENRTGLEYWINHYQTLLGFLRETQQNLTRAISQNPGIGENIVPNPQSLLGGNPNGGVMVSSHRRRKPKDSGPENQPDQPEVIDDRNV